jgi:hypothetical protein
MELVARVFGALRYFAVLDEASANQGAPICDITHREKLRHSGFREKFVSFRWTKSAFERIARGYWHILTSTSTRS